MRREVEAVDTARRLWRSDSTLQTVAAAVVMLAVIGVPLYQAYRSR